MKSFSWQEDFAACRIGRTAGNSHGNSANGLFRRCSAWPLVLRLSSEHLLARTFQWAYLWNLQCGLVWPVRFSVSLQNFLKFKYDCAKGGKTKAKSFHWKRFFEKNPLTKHLLKGKLWAWRSLTIWKVIDIDYRLWILNYELCTFALELWGRCQIGRY